MNSIKAKLTVWLITSMTLILCVTGYLSYYSNKENAEADYLELKSALMERLALSLPHVVWQLDEQYIRLSLDAELGWQSVVAIYIQGDAGLSIGRIRGKNGIRNMLPSDRPQADDILTIPIIYQKTEKLGTATVYLSRQALHHDLQTRLIEIIVQIVILDVLILILLKYTLQYLVFRPLEKLKRALNRAASGKNDGEMTLPFYQNNEFGEVAKGFNRIVDRITHDLSMRIAAEESAKQEKQKAQDAYEKLLETQQTLVESEKLASLGGLVAGVAHEINTPVGITLTTASHLANSTQQLSSLLQNGAIKKSDFQNYLSDASECCTLILSNAERAANLIQSFKQVAVDQTSEARRDFVLKDYLQEIITSLQPKLKRTHVQVEIVCNDKIIMDSYPGALSQVITNLVVNALMHAFEKEHQGSLRIIAEPLEKNKIELSLEDNGTGIAPENLGRIFDPFYTTKRGSGGSGLGLHIVYNIVRQRLGGNIEVKSQLGIGTTFTITIPAIAPTTNLKETT